eukprot:gene1605-3097_t
MARANLSVSSALADCFLSAQEGPIVRIIKVSIVNEEITVGTVMNGIGNAKDDFDSLLGNCLSEKEATIILFCLSDVDASYRKWLLLSWVPDNCAVRDKMLYSSSREDLKRSLGLGFFSFEYFANILTDLTWDSVMDYKLDDRIKGSLSETEKLVIEEKSLSQKESSLIKSAAMGVLPFVLSNDLSDKLIEFKIGSHNFIEMLLENEEIKLLKASTINMKENLLTSINNDEARFFALRLQRYNGDEIRVFVFSCPDNVPTRTKMIMSSAKATVLSTIGIKFDRTIEVRGAEDIEEQIWSEIEPSSLTSSSAAATLAHAKPARPGRGKAKIITVS